MRALRFTSFCLGLWLGGGLLMAWIAADSFRNLDSAVLQTGPSAGAVMKKLGPSAHSVTRRIVAEQNAKWFENWEMAQVLIGVLLFMYVLMGTKLRPLPIAAVLLMTLVAAGQRWLLTPEMISIVRTVDLTAIGPAAKHARVFWILHHTYSALEVLKYGLCLALIVRFSVIQGRRASDDAREEINLVDKANYRQVNR